MKMSHKPVDIEVNAFLVLFIPVIIVMFKIIPRIADWALSKYKFLAEKDADKVATAISIKQEMAKISMVDEFAKYAKLQRKLNQITLDLESTAQARQMLQVKAKSVVTIVMYVLSVIIYLTLLLVIGIRTPVFVIPTHWFYPVSLLLSYPTGIEGAISIPVWTVTMRNIISLVIK